MYNCTEQSVTGNYRLDFTEISAISRLKSLFYYFKGL